MNKLTNFDQYFCYFFGICKREHSGLPPQKEHDRPASHHEDADGRQRERKQGAGLSYSNHNL